IPATPSSARDPRQLLLPFCLLAFCLMSFQRSLSVLNCLLQSLQLGRVDLLVIEDIQYQQTGRTVEQPSDQVAQRTPARLPFVDSGTRRERLRIFFVDDVPLGLQDP